MQVLNVALTSLKKCYSVTVHTLPEENAHLGDVRVRNIEKRSRLAPESHLLSCGDVYGCVDCSRRPDEGRK